MDDLYLKNMLFQILNRYGKPRNDSLRVWMEYEDKYITISSPLERYTCTDYYVTLHLDNSLERREVFRLEKTITNPQTVCWIKAPEPLQAEIKYMRPGKWVQYVEKLFENLSKEHDEFWKLNGKPIDDDVLFG